jgi:hypothetical protein
VFQTVGGGQVRFLEHVVRVNTAQQSPVHAEVDHPPQTLLVLRKKRGQGLPVAVFQPLRQFVWLLDLVVHAGLHNQIYENLSVFSTREITESSVFRGGHVPPDTQNPERKTCASL